MGRDSATSLAPGFRFHPTDEELVRYYLKRKVTNKPFRFDPISVIDIYKSEPWDLPDKSKLKTRDLEWYFFSALDKKYGNGSKTNRATEKGYWKTTGKDRPIRFNSRTVGMKKTLVYHRGRAPRGDRTNWVMHEYRLTDEDLEKAGIVLDAFVLCRVFQKSGTGPKNGEQYGAPFIEEEWDDEEEVAMLPAEEVVVAGEVPVGDDAYVEPNDLDQNLDIGVASANTSLPLNVYYGETSNYPDYSRNLSEDDQKPIIGDRGNQYSSALPGGQNMLELPAGYEIKPVEDDYIAEPSNNVNADDVNYLFDEPYLDTTNNPPFNEGLFLEANDLSNPVEPNSAGDSTGFDIEEYLNFFDADDNFTFDPSEILGSEEAVSDQEPLSQKDVNRGTEEVSMASKELLEADGSSDASSSKQKPESMKFEPDVKYPFIKQASHILGGIPAPPAFASEFPTKDASLRLYSAQSSSSIHVTAGLIRIESMTIGGNGIDWSFGKNGNVNIVLSFGSLQDVTAASLVPMAGLFSGKTGSIVSRSWFLLMFFWVLVLSISFKVGTYICAK